MDITWPQGNPFPSLQCLLLPHKYNQTYLNMVKLRDFNRYLMKNVVCKVPPIKIVPQGGPVRTFGFWQRTLMWSLWNKKIHVQNFFRVCTIWTFNDWTISSSWIYKKSCELSRKQVNFGPSQKKQKIKTCIGGESNPGLPRGRREFYHWTTNAW